MNILFQEDLSVRAYNLRVQLTCLPDKVQAELKERLNQVEKQHQRDLIDGLGQGYLPNVIGRKNRNWA